MMLWNRRRCRASSYAMKSPAIWLGLLPPLVMIRQFRRWVAPSHSRLIAPHWSGTQLRNLSHPGFRPAFCSLGTTKELGPTPHCQSDLLPGGTFDDHRGDGRYHHTLVRCSLFGGASAPGAGPGRVRILHVAQRGIGCVPDACPAASP